MKLAWLTDIHLNFLDENQRKKFYKDVENTHCNAVLISGDIAEATCLLDILNEISDNIRKPIYFILGNHDYYQCQINVLQEKIKKLIKTSNNLFWLPASGIQRLDNNNILLGQDGWADGRFGDYKNSKVSLNDSLLIADLFQKKILGKFQLQKKMQQLADTDAKQLQNNLIQGVNQHAKNIIVLTHVPPFQEACWYNGKISDKDWLPYFSSKIVGDILLRAAQENPTIEFLTLCGHTHNAANFQPLTNLIIKVGGAKYYQPKVQEIITLPNTVST